MAKNVVKKIKLQIPAGKATPAPPIGTGLGPTGINLQEFCTKYNEATREKMGDIIPVEVSIYEDRTFDFVLKTPPTASLIKKAAGIEKGSTRNMGVAIKGLNDSELAEHAKEAAEAEAQAAKLEEALEEMEESAKAMAEGASVEVESTEQSKEDEEKANEE